MADRPLGIVGLVRILLRSVRPYHLLAAVVLATLVVDVGVDVGQRFAFRFLIDDALVPGDAQALVIVLAALAGSVVVGGASAILRDLLYARLSASLLRDLRERLFLHLQRLSVGFHARARSGDLMSRFSNDILSLENALFGLATGLLCVFGIAFSLASLFVLEWRLTVVCLVGLPLTLAGPWLLAPRAASASHVSKEALGRLASTVQENLAAQTVVRVFRLHDVVLDAFRRRQQEVVDATLRFSRFAYLAERTPNVAVQVVSVAVLSTGAYFVAHGSLTVGSLVAYHVLFLSLASSVHDLTTTIPFLLQAAGGMQRIEEILAEVPEVDDAPDAAALPPLAREIAFEDVTFGHEPGRSALAGTSLTIRAGTTVAFVGASGSGKSTALALLLRFHDPQRGRVTFDGRDLRGVMRASLYGQVSAVFQESFLFDTSIRENIRLGRPGASDADVEEAARAAAVHDAIAALPAGYDTGVGERGGSLSGGQRQRIAIARAILNRPRVLLLDEATSALDPATEESVNETLRSLAQGRTVVAVTHRLASAVHADRIVVFDRGRVVEEGPHDELVQRDGVYRGLWERQSGLTVSPDGAHVDVRVEWLRRLHLFAGADEAVLGEIQPLFASESFAAGRDVVVQGDPADRFYIVARGKVAVVLRHDDGTEARLAVLTDGDSFGEIALLRPVPRTATVRTLAPSVFVTLRRRAFETVLARAPEFRRAVERALEERMERLQAESAKA